MMRRLFSYAWESGTFSIREAPEGKVALYIDEHFLDTFRTPRNAAEAVRRQESGWLPWDEGADFKPAPAISKWKREKRRLQAVTVTEKTLSQPATS